MPELVALVIALSGLGLIGSAFAPWARATGTISSLDDISFMVSFPGVGSPSLHGSGPDFTADFVGGSLRGANPGWVGIAAGVVFIAIAAAYYFAWNRKIVGVLGSVLGVAVLVVCVSHTMDLNAAVGNPPLISNVELTAGLGLIASIVLAAAATVAGAAAFAIEQRSSP